MGLTPAGELLLPHCQRVLAEVEAVRARFAALGPEALRLRLRVDPGYGRLVVTPLVPRFMERFGNVQLTVAVMDSLPQEPSQDWDLLICNGIAAEALEPDFFPHTARAARRCCCVPPPPICRSMAVRRSRRICSHTR